MRTRSGTGIAVAGVVALLLSACGEASDPEPEEVQADLSEELQELIPALDAEQADCFAGLVVDDVGADQLNDIDLSDEEPPEELAGEIASAAAAAAEECDIDAAAVGG